MVRQLVEDQQIKQDSLKLDPIPIYPYRGGLKDEIDRKNLTADQAKLFLEQMVTIREFESMIERVRSGQYKPLAEINNGAPYVYRGPTHLCIGQEAASVGMMAALNAQDYIVSSHRGHGDTIAKGFFAICEMDSAALKGFLGSSFDASLGDDELREKALEEHIFRTVAELFGKHEGYCRGRGGSMHIAHFGFGHLGNNAIVGGSAGILTGAAVSARYRRSGQVGVHIAGDGAYSNGIVLESLNFAAQAQFKNPDLTENVYGLPVIFIIVNNEYAMTGRESGEITGVEFLAQRAAGFSSNNMHAEVVDAMNILAVHDSMRSAVELARDGEGPVLRELRTYRYRGHSLSDDRTAYRDDAEEAIWEARDPVANFKGELLDLGLMAEKEYEDIIQRVEERNARAAVRAAVLPEPDPSTVTDYIFADTTSDEVPKSAVPKKKVSPPERKGEVIKLQDAIREALVEEMARDSRVVFYGEDVADYGGAFKVTVGLLDLFGRERVFNVPISEAAIIGTGVGAAMTGLRPIVELMYSDFELQAGDQLYNQAAKWSFMSGGQTSVPMVIRTSQGAGKGYGGQHSQCLESFAAHIPGIKVAIPSTPYDAKGLLKTAIRDDNPVLFVENQNIYGLRGPVPTEEYLIPFGEADIKREGEDVTVVAWSFMAQEALKAAEKIQKEYGKSVEVVDPRTLVPFDIDTIIESVRKTNRAIVASQAVRFGSFTAQVASDIQELAFDYLDGPVLRVGAQSCISPQSQILEQTYLPYAADIEAAIKQALSLD